MSQIRKNTDRHGNSPGQKGIPRKEAKEESHVRKVAITILLKREIRSIF